MGKAEIAKKFDEIVAFAGVDRFIDTPVKRYSSGMYVRLAFSIAAHVESEILVIDEILAVGDAKFQKSCIERIGQIERAGRTVLFVSHNMATVRHLCTKGILLESGKIAAQGDIGGVISRYVDELPAIEGSRLNFQRRESEKPQIASIGFVNQQLVCGESLAIDFECWSGEMMEAAIELEIHDERGAPIIYSSTFPTGNTLLKLAGGVTTKFRLRTSPLNLATGDYFLYVWLMKPWVENFDALKSPLRFSVTESDIGGSGFEFKQSYGRGAVAVTLDVVPAS
jgi:lipopolysaccharide transport system ATP-binding protein